MIKSVRLVNFFSFGDCTIDLESDLNVLVGINGSGKSNFLRAFQLLKAGMEGRLQEQIAQWGGTSSLIQKGITRYTSSKMEMSSEIELSFTLSGENMHAWPDGYQDDIIYKIFLLPVAHSFLVYESVERPDGQIYFNSLGGKVNISSSATIRVTNDDINKLTDNGRELLLPTATINSPSGLASIFLMFRDLNIYKMFNTSDDSPIRTAIRATGVDKLLANGDNMFQILNIIGLRSVTAYNAIEDGLRDVNEKFQRFRVNVYGQGSMECYLQEKGLETPVHAAQISDGTLCYLCLLVALYQPFRGNILIFDEPERNLHPDMLFELAKQLEKASEKSQIILTTHAPGLLNQFPLRSVRVFEKDENNQTTVKKFTEEDFAGWYDEFAPGQMWRNGDLGGNRY